MTFSGHRRQVVLFLFAVLLPCAVLVALSLRMVRQERELSEKRLAEEQRRVVSEIHQELLSHLEKIKLQAVSALAAGSGRTSTPAYEDPAVVLIGRVEKDRLILPWERSASVERARKLLRAGEFAARIQEGEHAELFKRELTNAVALYQEAVRAARHPLQVAYAHLLLARALVKAGRWDEAQVYYQKVLMLSSEFTDEHGVPLFLYAGARLLEADRAHGAVFVLERIRSEVDADVLLGPEGTYLLDGLRNTLATSAREPQVREASKELQTKIARRIRHVEQALALQNDFSHLGLLLAARGQPQKAEPLWIPYGEEPWLVSTGEPMGSLPTTLIAVYAAKVFTSVGATSAESSSGAVQFVAGEEAKGEPLGSNFPGLRVAFSAGGESTLARKWNPQRWFYFASLLLVLCLTLFGAYLLWRDVRRELRVAEMRSQFVSSVSHELKTPLTAIRMFAETLRMRRAADRGAQNEYLDTIISESERLTRLLNNVLDFSKIEQGQKIYKPRPTSLPEVVHAAARAMHYPLAQQGFRLRVEIEDSLPPLPVDADALEQAILNLLTNAVKYSGASREIDLSLRSQNGHAVIEVTDRGIGIPASEQPRVFEKFYRVPTPENQLVPGTGLGLTLVEHIARAHGGYVTVRSAPGQGSTFSIHVPLGTPP